MVFNILVVAQYSPPTWRAPLRASIVALRLLLPPKTPTNISAKPTKFLTASSSMFNFSLRLPRLKGILTSFKPFILTRSSFIKPLGSVLNSASKKSLILSKV